MSMDTRQVWSFLGEELGGAKRLKKTEVVSRLKHLESWDLSGNAKSIFKEYLMKDFMAAVRFIERIAKVAEAEGHHPDLHLSGYRKLRIEISTHAIGGLSENDFILAAKIDKLPRHLEAR